MGALGIETLAIQCLTGLGPGALELVKGSASLPEGKSALGLLQCTTTPPGALVSGTPATQCWLPPRPRGTPSLPWCPGTATRAMHCLSAWGQWEVDLLQYTASLPGGSGQWKSCNALPLCLGAVGTGTRALRCLTVLETAPKLRGSALQEFNCPLHPDTEAVDCRHCTVHYPQAVRHCIARVPMPSASRQ